MIREDRGNDLFPCRVLIRVLMHSRPAAGRWPRGREGCAEDVQRAAGDVGCDVSIDVGGDRDPGVPEDLGGGLGAAVLGWPLEPAAFTRSRTRASRAVLRCDRPAQRRWGGGRRTRCRTRRQFRRRRFARRCGRSPRAWSGCSCRLPVSRLVRSPCLPAGERQSHPQAGGWTETSGTQATHGSPRSGDPAAGQGSGVRFGGGAGPGG
jgi:hypothetical protein